MTGSLALAEAGNGIFFAFALERIVHSGLEGLSVDRELQFYHALFELFTGNAAVLGGIGIIPGAMIGGILVGLIEIFVKLFAPGWYEAVTYGTLIVILLVKPAGILGKNTGEKV